MSNCPPKNFKTIDNYEKGVREAITIDRPPTKEQLDAVGSYQEDSREINSSMRGHTPMNEDIKHRIARIKEISSGIRLTEDIHLVRGYKLNPGAPLPRAGSTLSDMAFTSMTTDLKTAEKYSKGGSSGEMILHIDVPKGTSIIPASYLTGKKPDEKEITLMPGQEIYIREVVLSDRPGEPDHAYGEVRKRQTKK
jgi:hypothetical protein